MWRPSTSGRFAGAQGTDVTPIGAVRWLAVEAGLTEATVENIVYRKHHTTELRIADAIVTALGRPEAVHDGTLQVRPNPGASRHVRASCCGGSTIAA